MWLCWMVRRDYWRQQRALPSGSNGRERQNTTVIMRWINCARARFFLNPLRKSSGRDVLHLLFELKTMLRPIPTATVRQGRMMQDERGAMLDRGSPCCSALLRSHLGLAPYQMTSLWKSILTRLLKLKGYFFSLLQCRYESAGQLPCVSLYTLPFQDVNLSQQAHFSSTRNEINRLSSLRVAHFNLCSCTVGLLLLRNVLWKVLSMGTLSPRLSSQAAPQVIRLLYVHTKLQQILLHLPRWPQWKGTIRCLHFIMALLTLRVVQQWDLMRTIIPSIQFTITHTISQLPWRIQWMKSTQK